MTHKRGTVLGSISTLAELRSRCRVDSGGPGCWHILTKRGEPFGGQQPRLWLHGVGSVSAIRLAYCLAFGDVGADRVVYRVCDSRDCVNPQHIRRGTRAMKLRHQSASGNQTSGRKTRANRLSGLARSRISAEMRRWIVESGQTGVELALVFDVAHTHISALRARARRDTLQKS